MIANKQIYSFIFIAFVAHIFAINFYPVNFEYSFAEASKFIKSYNLNILQDFFAHQANTITFSIFIGYINKILFFLNSYQVAKAISAASYLFIGMGLINLAKSHKIQNLSN